MCKYNSWKFSSFLLKEKSNLQINDSLLSPESEEDSRQTFL